VRGTEEEEEEVSSYWMTSRTRADNEYRNRKH